MTNDMQIKDVNKWYARKIFDCVKGIENTSHLMFIHSFVTHLVNDPKNGEAIDNLIQIFGADTPCNAPQ